ncbi:ORF080 virion core protein [Orf virus]|uniref:ORF080 virion core protein n=1 Tax=Orf virus (strain Goat/Texas/SA00/2000) TaxID=647330 RepID=Q6TVP0_ORFSA|nr:ORF080 virion core protein [Orf virus]AAR98305.1 ORF080 virion core protein [Orf virus]
MDLRRRFASDLAKTKLVLSETSSSLFTKCPQAVIPTPEQPCPPDEEVDSVDKYTVKEAGRYYQSRLKSTTACMQRPTGQSPLAPSPLPRGARIQSVPLNVMPAACSTPVAACSATAVVCPPAAPACPAPAPACPAPVPACPAPAPACPAPAPACPAPAVTCPAPAPACPPATAPTCPPPAVCPAPARPAPACPPSTRQCPPAPPLPTKPAPAAKPIFLQQSLPPPQYPASSCPTIKAPAASPVLEPRVPDKIIDADNDDKDLIKKELADIADSVRDLNAESLSLTRDIETAKSVTQSAIDDLRRLLGSVATRETPSTLRDRVDNTGTS